MAEKVLVIGASPAEWRYSNIATKMLKDYGHSVVCFGKQQGFCAGEPIQQSFPETTDFDTITMYINPEHQKDYYDRIVQLKPKRIIFNPGTENEEFEALLDSAGIAVEEACTLVLLRTGQYANN